MKITRYKALEHDYKKSYGFFCAVDYFCKKYSPVIKENKCFPLNNCIERRNRPHEILNSEITNTLLLYQIGSLKNFKDKMYFKEVKAQWVDSDFKFHSMCNDKGEIISFFFSSDNTDDHDYSLLLERFLALTRTYLKMNKTSKKYCINVRNPDEFDELLITII